MHFLGWRESDTLADMDQQLLRQKLLAYHCQHGSIASTRMASMTAITPTVPNENYHF